VGYRARIDQIYASYNESNKRPAITAADRKALRKLAEAL
jgi:hypothetical protein